MNANELRIQKIANSCNIGAEWLEKLAGGEREPKDIILSVAAGLRDATQNIDTRDIEIITGIVSCCRLYFYHIERGDKKNAEFFSERLAAYYSEMKEREVDTSSQFLKKGIWKDEDNISVVK